MILEMKNIEKSFGDLEVLKDISFGVDHGEVVSVIGPSGSRSEEHTSELQSRI